MPSEAEATPTNKFPTPWYSEVVNCEARAYDADHHYLFDIGQGSNRHERQKALLSLIVSAVNTYELRGAVAEAAEKVKQHIEHFFPADDTDFQAWYELVAALDALRAAAVKPNA